MAGDKIIEAIGRPELSRMQRVVSELGLKQQRVMANGLFESRNLEITRETYPLNIQQFELLDRSVTRLAEWSKARPQQTEDMRDAFAKARMIIHYAKMHEDQPKVYPKSLKMEEFSDPKVALAAIALLSQQQMDDIASQPDQPRMWAISPRDLDRLPNSLKLKSAVIKTMDRMKFETNEGGVKVATIKGSDFAKNMMYSYASNVPLTRQPGVPYNGLR